MTASVRSLVRKTGNSIVSICCCNIQGDRVGFVEYVSRTLSSTTSVTKIIFLIFINLVTPKVCAKHEPLFNKPASEHLPPLFFILTLWQLYYIFKAHLYGQKHRQKQMYLPWLLGQYNSKQYCLCLFEYSLRNKDFCNHCCGQFVMTFWEWKYISKSLRLIYTDRNTCKRGFTCLSYLGNMTTNKNNPTCCRAAQGTKASTADVTCILICHFHALNTSIRFIYTTKNACISCTCLGWYDNK